MPKHSQIMEDTIRLSHQVSKDMRKAYEKKMDEERKRAGKLKQKSIVDEFIKDQEKKKPQLTPAEKTKRTKAKKKAQQEDKERLVREKESMEKWLVQKKIREKSFKEALDIGSGKSPL